MGWFRSPYGAWMTMRLIWIACMIALPVFFFAFLFSGTGNYWMLAILIPSAVLVQGDRYWTTRKSGGMSIRGNRVSGFLDMIGRRLSPHQCPHCGQSCFNNAPASGYASETMKAGFWPNSVCHNCGADLTVPSKP
ncbi:MAG: hypothetical protein SXU28_00865 [Pseudomonadota bacterium]|nr:hypothetical protein [Pseudomonadota bacterium]